MYEEEVSGLIYGNEEYQDQSEEKRRIPLDERLCLILLAVCPILQHYKGLLVNASVTILVALFPYIVIKLLKKRTIALSYAKIVLPLVIFFLYKVIDHGTDVMEAGQAVIFCVLVIAVAGGCFSTKYYIRVVTVVSAFASACIIVQYLCYYLLGRHIQMVPTGLLLDKSSQWILGAQTGRAGITGIMTKFYRPSAFFLEPSHMFIFMFIPLTLLMFAPNQSRKERWLSILISVGIVFSTSGMGIVTVIALWLLYLGKRKGLHRRFSIKKLLQPKTLFFFMLAGVGLIVLYLEVPFFQNSINRIIGSGADYSNAIEGRVARGNELVSRQSGMAFLIGVGDTLAGITFNMSGFNETIYLYGIIGVFISYSFYVHGLFKLKNSYFWICVIIIILSFFSIHTHSTFFMIYNTFVFVEGYSESLRQKKRTPRSGVALMNYA